MIEIELPPGTHRCRSYKITVKMQDEEDVTFTKKAKVTIRFGRFHD